jgi:hypothetical protein
MERKGEMHVHNCSEHGGAFTCTCPVGHIKSLRCRTGCTESLRTVNAKLLEALEEIEVYLEDGAINTALEIARAAIKEAKK